MCRFWSQSGSIRRAIARSWEWRKEVAKKLKLHSCGMDENQSVGDGTVKAINSLLNSWGYKQNGIAGEKFIKRLKAEIEKRVK